MRRVSYPFAAIVGQERVKKAILLNLINPKIGGVLLSGEKGTAKSTIVRAAAELGDKEVIDLPLNATEDMLVGTIDFQKTMQEGKRCFQGGILKRADQNILYVDEVNLLADRMASAVLTAASSGENLVEREGISDRHACSFVLVGTMNPEEGRLRPQLLDKFGLFVEVTGEKDVEQRVEILKRRIAYERDPLAFIESYAEETRQCRALLRQAAGRLSKVRVDESVRRLAAKLAGQAFCEGNRAEILLVETARTIAALKERSYVGMEEIREAAEYVLPHRRRQEEKDSASHPKSEQPKEPAPSETETQEQDQTPNPPQEEPDEAAEAAADETPEDEEGETDRADDPMPDEEAPARDELVEGEEMYQIIRLPGEGKDRKARKGSGRRRKTKSSVNRGRYAGFSMTKEHGVEDLALDATLRAAAPFQRQREKGGCAVAIRESDFRYKKRENHVGATILFVVDASGSMGAAKRMKETKEAILSMLMDSYQKRDKVGLIAFRRQKAQILLGITASVDLAQKELQILPTGGRTPLADGLYCAWQLFEAQARKDTQMLPLLVLVTDGRANQPLWTEDALEDAVRAARLIASAHIPAIVVDTENDFLSFHLAEEIAREMEASYFKVNELKSTQLKGIVSLKQSILQENGEG